MAFTVQMADFENTILREIAAPEMKRDDAALTYAFGLRNAANGEKIDWPKVNAAIIARWSRSALIYIKERAWKIYEGKIQPGVTDTPHLPHPE